MSWETDERGFIAEDEEAACGLAFDLAWLSDRNMSLGVEGGNGKKTALFEPFIYKMHYFAKTGSGQT